METVNELLKVIKDLAPKNSETQLETQLEKRLSEQISNKIDKVKTVYFYPKIGIATVSGIISYIWLFPESFAKHPVLGSLIKPEYGSSLFTPVWIFTLLIACMIWFLIAIRENRDKNLKLKLKLEYFQNELFKDFIESEDTKENFTKDDFAIFLNTSYRKYLIDIELAQRAIRSVHVCFV